MKLLPVRHTFLPDERYGTSTAPLLITEQFLRRLFPTAYGALRFDIIVAAQEDYRVTFHDVRFISKTRVDLNAYSVYKVSFR